MSEDKKKAAGDQSPIEREILEGRKFSVAEAIGRLAGGDLLKGDSPIPRKRQSEYEVERYLEEHLIDSAGALEVVLLRRVKNGDVFLKGGFEQPLSTLVLLIEHILSSEPLLRDFVNEVDREWARMFRERPYLQTSNDAPHPDDPYTLASVGESLSNLASELRGRQTPKGRE